MNHDSSTALVLAGGGARGAYEAGVMLYVLKDLAQKEGLNPRFNIFAGTSIGALNCCMLSAYADKPQYAAEQLIKYWESITFKKIIHFGYFELRKIFNILSGRKKNLDYLSNKYLRPPEAPHAPIEGFFNSSPLYHEMEKAINWNRIQECFNKHALKGVAVCATELCTGKSIIFYQDDKDGRLVIKKDPSKIARYVKINLNHAMASAAIPMIFPAVQINGTCYTDGSLRQNTPLYPAARLGAQKMMVVSLSQKPEIEYSKARIGCRRNRNPGIFFLFGKMLKVMVTDELDYELQRLEMFNNLINSGQAVYGQNFLENINEATRQYRNTDYRIIKNLLIRPNKCLNSMAINALEKAPDEIRLPGIPGKLLQKVLCSNMAVESDLLSFLMFTPTYIRELIELGYEDAKNKKDDLIDFFLNPSLSESEFSE